MKGEGPLIPLSDTLFQMRGSSVQVHFPGRPEGKAARATLREGSGADIPLRRVEPWNPTVQELRAFAGRYYSPELKTIYTFAVEDSQLVARHRWHGTLRFTTPGSKGTFQAEEAGIQVQFERNEVGLITGYYASVWRTHDVWFGRRE